MDIARASSHAPGREGGSPGATMDPRCVGGSIYPHKVVGVYRPATATAMTGARDDNGAGPPTSAPDPVELPGGVIIFTGGGLVSWFPDFWSLNI
jgi:hypothetical protein